LSVLWARGSGKDSAPRPGDPSVLRLKLKRHLRRAASRLDGPAERQGRSSSLEQARCARTFVKYRALFENFNVAMSGRRFRTTNSARTGLDVGGAQRIGIGAAGCSGAAIPVWRPVLEVDARGARRPAGRDACRGTPVKCTARRHSRPTSRPVNDVASVRTLDTSSPHFPPR